MFMFCNEKAKISIFNNNSIHKVETFPPNPRLTSNVWAGYSPRLLRARYSPSIFRTRTLLSLTNSEVVKT